MNPPPSKKGDTVDTLTVEQMFNHLSSKADKSAKQLLYGITAIVLMGGGSFGGLSVLDARSDSDLQASIKEVQQTQAQIQQDQTRQSTTLQHLVTTSEGLTRAVSELQKKMSSHDAKRAHDGADGAIEDLQQRMLRMENHFLFRDDP
jgi:septal ring factor EnvC (AmiA/AmiB activator)